jgi:hypothetical protein
MCTIIGFPARSHEEQLTLALAYAACTSNSARKSFVKLHATRWSEFFRLPYFDVCRMIVIDPMHNLLLGTTVPSCAILC